LRTVHRLWAAKLFATQLAECGRYQAHDDRQQQHVRTDNTDEASCCVLRAASSLSPGLQLIGKMGGSHGPIRRRSGPRPQPVASAARRDASPPAGPRSCQSAFQGSCTYRSAAASGYYCGATGPLYGLWVVNCGLWTMGFEFCAVAVSCAMDCCGLWVVGNGLPMGVGKHRAQNAPDTSASRRVNAWLVPAASRCSGQRKRMRACIHKLVFASKHGWFHVRVKLRGPKTGSSDVAGCSCPVIEANHLPENRFCRGGGGGEGLKTHI